MPTKLSILLLLFATAAHSELVFQARDASWTATMVAAAAFAPNLPTSGELIYTRNDNCLTVPNAANLAGKVVLYDREDACPYDQKAFLFQAIGVKALIVNNDVLIPFLPEAFLLAFIGQKSVAYEVNIPVVAIGYEAADQVKALLRTSNSTVTVTFQPESYLNTDQLSMFDVYFLGTAFVFLVVLQAITIVLNKTVGGSPSELVATSIGFATSCLMLVSIWLDQFGSTNVLPRAWMITLWNIDIVLIFEFLYWFLWVWMQALIAGSDFDTETFRRRVKIVALIAVITTAACEIPRNILLAVNHDWVLTYRIFNTITLFIVICVVSLLGYIAIKLRSRIMKSVQMLKQNNIKPSKRLRLLRTLTLGGIPAMLGGSLAAVSLLIWVIAPGLFGSLSLAIFVLIWKSCVMFALASQFTLWMTSLSARRTMALTFAKGSSAPSTAKLGSSSIRSNSSSVGSETFRRLLARTRSIQLYPRTDFKYGSNAISDERLFFFVALCPNIQNVRLDQCVHLHSKSYLRFAPLTQVRILHAHKAGIAFNEAAIENLSKALPNLTKLCISECEGAFSQAVSGALKRLMRLESVSLVRNVFLRDQEVFTAIGTLHATLQHLNISIEGTIITPDSMKQLAQLTRLRTLRAGFFVSSGVVYSPLTSLVNLVSATIYLSDHPASLVSNAFAHLPLLQSISVPNYSDTELVDQLARMPQLRELLLHEPRDFNALAPLAATLRKLTITSSSTEFHHRTRQAAAKALPLTHIVICAPRGVK